MELPFLKLHSDAAYEEPDEYLLADRTMAGALPGFGDDGGGFGDFGADDAGGFGEDFHATTDADFGDKGGETWGDVGEFGDDNPQDGQGFEPLKEMNGAPGQFIMALSGEEGENILSYFDERGGKNWAGPEHWRIQRIKKGILHSHPPKETELMRFVLLANSLCYSGCIGSPRTKENEKRKRSFRNRLFLHRSPRRRSPVRHRRSKHQSPKNSMEE